MIPVAITTSVAVPLVSDFTQMSLAMDCIPKVIAAFLPPALSFLCFANLCRSSRSLCNRAAVLSYNCPLNDRPYSCGFFCSVDSHLRWLAAARRKVGVAVVLDMAERRALDGA
jgi:hypothetical protein